MGIMLKKSGRKIKYPQMVHLIDKLVYIMMGKTYIEKYLDLRSRVAKIYINNVVNL